MLTPDDQLEIACLVGPSTSCRALELLDKATKAYREEKERSKALREWIKILNERIERYEKG